MQSDMEMIPIIEFEFDLQAKQPVGPIYMPAMHSQAVIAVLPQIECEFIGQCKHPLGCMYMSARQLHF